MAPILGILASSFFQPTGDYQAIMTATVDSGGASSITFSSIPSTYKHLQIRGLVRDARATTFDWGGLAYNSDTGTNYSDHGIWGNGSSVSANGDSSIGPNDGLIYAIPGTSANANVFGVLIIDILDYANTSKYKTTRILSGVEDNGSGQVMFSSQSWRNTAAINAITLKSSVGSSMSQYSSFALYGVKG